MWKIFAILASILLEIYSTTYPVYATSCPDESATRVCPQSTNTTEYLLNLKKGGTDVLSSADYDADFFVCEEYTFDCGYVENQQQTVSIANGIQLEMTATQIDTILPASPTLADNIKHYLNLTASDAKCGMKVFPLVLTAAQSDTFFQNYMTILVTQIKNNYGIQKANTSKTWAELNINIKTAVAEVIKQDSNLLNNSFWEDFKANNFSQMSDYLKYQFNQTDDLYYLRSAYLIDSVTQRCNKVQSVNFLVDESGSIGPPNFALALQFLTKYTTQTLDDPTLTSMHFYDSTFQSYLDFGHTKAQLLAGIAAKTYRALGTKTGDAINRTIAKILAASFPKGLNKVLIVMTDGKSSDLVLQASNYARSKDITMIAVGIGPAVNDTQLLEIAQTPSNVIKATSYSDLGKLVSFIQNFFCKQIINLRLNQTIVGNQVRSADSPSFFRVQKSATGQLYELRIDYEADPDTSSQQLYTSEYDPFPDQFTQFEIKQFYRTSITQRVYFITPKTQNQLRVKKDYYKTETVSNSYLSVGGSNLHFNISLKPCSTPNCTVQRTAYSNYGSKKDITPLSDKDYNIYAIIAGSIAGLICLSLLGAAALKKVYGQQEDIDPLENMKLQPELTQQDINDHINDQQSISNRSDKSKHSHHSKGSHHHSNHLNHSDRSNKHVNSQKPQEKAKGNDQHKNKEKSNEQNKQKSNQKKKEKSNQKKKEKSQQKIKNKSNQKKKEKSNQKKKEKSNQKKKENSHEKRSNSKQKWKAKPHH